MITQSEIWINTSFIDFHCWPQAPDVVKYLRSLHRHKFNVRVQVRVKHDDRDVEFHCLKSDVDSAIVDLRRELQVHEGQSMSCEMLARSLLVRMQRAGYIVAFVEVDEDGECGAKVSL